MTLRFQGDAIELSGTTGTLLKSEILGDYYEVWWKITSGGDKKKAHSLPTAIVELDAGSGENYISDTKETILGSSGHALQLKAETPGTSELKLVLVERDGQCFSHLQNVIKRRWKVLRWTEQVVEGDVRSDVFLINKDLPNALEEIQKIKLGNSLFFFDPLLFTPWEHIENVARRRIRTYYHTGTEFIVFLFTSDWFAGRPPLVASLPTENDGKSWTVEQKEAVLKVDSLFGHNEWRPRLLNSKHAPEKMNALVELYRERLHKWFRYVVPFPFEPKTGQLYHLFMCSNYETGVRVTRDFYAMYTQNEPYKPDNRKTYDKFIGHHPEKRMKGNSKSDEWQILWKVIRYHEEGLCDIHCRDIIDVQQDESTRKLVMEWLASKGYLSKTTNMTDAWDDIPDLYRLNWSYVTEKLGVFPPAPFRPLPHKPK